MVKTFKELKKMKYLIRTVLSLVLVAGIVACDESKQFEEELYKHVFAIISSDSCNIFEDEYDLEKVEASGFIAVSMGGTTLTDKDLRITLEIDSSLLDRFNSNTYENPKQYVRFVPSDKYTIESFDLTLPAGSRIARLPLNIRPEGLSPDSIYMIPLRVKAYSAYEINPDKSDVLYSVRIKNSYATLKPSGSIYTMTYHEGNVVSEGKKRLFPLTANSVRMMAGVMPYVADPDLISKGSVKLEIDGDGNVSINPVDPLWLSVTKLEGDDAYTNQFFIDDNGYKTFRLYYEYKTEDNPDPKTVREELKLEHKESSINN
jgi:hypothetical protein